ncbi:MAG: amidohydrolase [Flavisolibacter sp.]
MAYSSPKFSVGGPSKEEIVDSLGSLVKRATPHQWIQVGIGLNVFNDASVRRPFLDSICPNNPVALMVMWGHGMILNSKALQAVKIQDTSKDPLSGWYERSTGTNKLTGLLFEGAQFPVWQAITISEPAKLIKALRSHAYEELALGITTVQNMSSCLQGAAAKHFFKKANLPVRTRLIAMPGSTDKGRSLGEWEAMETKISSLTYSSGIKYVIDGTRLEQTALITTPYLNKKDWFGRLNFPEDTLQQILKEALTSNRQLLMHVVGDSATKLVLFLMKEIATDAEWVKKRVRIEHGSGLQNETEIRNIKNMGIVIVHTPQYGKNAHLRTLLATGVPIAIGPDGLINPYLNILMVTTQQTNPKENLTLEEAVIAYTKGGAYAEFKENYKGTIVKGMLADMAVLSQDIFIIPALQLPDTKSLLTILMVKLFTRKDLFARLKSI